MIGIYKITSPSNKIYIGSSIDINRRFKKYKRLQCKAQRRIYNSFLKYGVDNHIFEVIHECNIDELLKYESIYGNQYNVLGDKGLNCRLPKTDDTFVCFSEETKKLMSIAHKGQTPTNLEQLRQINIGRKPTEETKNKISIANKGKLPDLVKLKQLHEKSKKVIIDINTGKSYLGASAAAKDYCISRTHLYRMLNGKRNNTTSLIYE